MTTQSGAPPVVVVSPPALPPRTELSLVSAAALASETRTPNGGSAIPTWVGGVTWRPDNVATGGAADPCAPGNLNVGANLGKQEAFPIMIWEGERCTTASESIEEAQRRARALLEATTSKRLASEFWRGDLAAANAWPNPYLSRSVADVFDGATPPLVKQIGSGSTLNPIAALAALEQAIATYGTGARGMIHCTRRTALVWAAYFLLQQTGGLTLTALGNIVVADAGYDGTAPGHPAAALGGNFATGQEAWAYATGMVTVRLSEIEVSGAQRANEQLPNSITPDGETVVRAPGVGNLQANDRVVIASRYALATFDPAILAGVHIDHQLELSDTTHWSATLP